MKKSFMYKEKWETSDIKISRLILKRKEVILPLLLIACGVAIGLLGIRNTMRLTRDLRSSVTIFCSVMGKADISKMLLEMDEVQTMSECREGRITLRLGDYFGEFKIYGLETEYLNMYYGDDMEVSMEQEMPYILLDEGVFLKLKNKNGKSLETDAVDDYIMTTVTIGESRENARVCGIIHAKKAGRDINKTVTETLDTEKQQTDNSDIDVAEELCNYTTLEGFEKLVRQPSDSDNEKSDFLVVLKDGRGLENALKQIRQYGIEVEVPEDLQQKIDKRKQLYSTIKIQMMIGVIFVLEGYIIFYYQQCLWKWKHSDFLFWMQNIFSLEKSKKMCPKAWFLLTARSGLLGVGIYVVILIMFNAVCKNI